MGKARRGLGNRSDSISSFKSAVYLPGYRFLTDSVGDTVGVQEIFGDNLWDMRRSAVFCCGLWRLLLASWNPSGCRSGSVLVPPMAEYELWVYQFCLDMALAGQRQTLLGVVGIDYFRLAGCGSVKSEFWTGISGNIHFPGDQQLSRDHGVGLICGICRFMYP